MIVKENTVGSLIIYTENEVEKSMIEQFLLIHSNNIVKSCVFTSYIK